MKRRKYATGTSVKGYLQHPGTALAQDKIDLADATHQAETNPFTRGLSFLGNAGMAYGIQAGGFNTIPGINGEDGEGGGGDILNNLMSMAGSYAAGGSVENVPVEVEGQEMGETPDGQLLEFEGPSHEEGGIDVDLPEGTDIYSKRIKVNGKTMADRKTARERRRERLEKLMQTMPVGELSRNSVKRGTQNLDAEDERDMGAQNLIRQATEAMEAPVFATGGTARGKYLPGGTIPMNMLQMFDSPEFRALFQNGDPFGKGMQTNDINMLQGASESPSKMIGASAVLANSGQANALPIQLGQNEGPNYGFDTGSYDNLAPQQPNQMAMDPAQYPGLAVDPTMGAQPLLPVGATPEDGQPRKARPDYLGSLPGMENLTAGDTLGMAGSLYSTFAGMDNVRANRAGDSPNVNFFENFGEDALQTNSDAMGYVNDQTDSALYDLNLSRNSAIRRGRNSARGANTQRALDLTSTQSADRTGAAIRANDSGQMAQILGQRSGLQNQRDQVQMQGDTQRDLADRQDRDNFYTQLGVAKMGKGLGLQEMGKDMNAVKQRAVINNLMKYLPRYGYTIDKNGNLVETGK